MLQAVAVLAGWTLNKLRKLQLRANGTPGVARHNPVLHTPDIDFHREGRRQGILGEIVDKEGDEERATTEVGDARAETWRSRDLRKPNPKHKR